MSEVLVRKMRWILALCVVSLLIASCNSYKIPEVVDVSSCEGCHTNLAHLKDVFTPDTAAPAAGCGGEAPHYEPWERVEMTGDGYEAYKAGSHGSMACTSCHGGINGTDQKDIAHSEDFIRHPSDHWETKCLPCHEEDVKHFANSLHNGTGQKRKVTMRSGLAGPHEFDMLSEQKKEGYNNNCANCHGTCGNCHIVRPALAGGGLSNGHEFIKKPDMKKICIKCHSSRGGHAYLGIDPDTEKDVHYTSTYTQFDCMNCHKGAELHGSADSTITHRYQYQELPTCERCHPDLLEEPNLYHAEHLEDFNCQVCHSQDYNNCGSCHVHGDGARVGSYMDFKIARNPIPEVKTGYDFVLVRRTLAAPDNWSKYGADDYSDFDAFPTYNFTTPHNILKFTSRTIKGAGENNCSNSCHISISGNDTVNKHLYLFEDDMDLVPGIDWETSANASIVVDGHLPTKWLE